MAKKELIAVHCIIHGKGEQANPNELFSIDESSVDSLIASGAARFPEEAPRAKSAAKPAKATRAKSKGKKDDGGEPRIPPADPITPPVGHDPGAAGDADL